MIHRDDPFPAFVSLNFTSGKGSSFWNNYIREKKESTIGQNVLHTSMYCGVPKLIYRDGYCVCHKLAPCPIKYSWEYLK